MVQLAGSSRVNHRVSSYAGSGDSVYATSALRSIVSRAAMVNRAAPGGIASYQGRVTSEIGLLQGTPEGIERLTQVEQTESDIQWARGTTGVSYDQHIVGYRSQALGFGPSIVATLGRSWVVPVLSGQRLALLFGGADSGGVRGRVRGAGQSFGQGLSVEIVHPLAINRETVYTFAGGDTTSVSCPAAEPVDCARSVIRIFVRLGAAPLWTKGTALFRGEMDLDPATLQVVRLRGQVVVHRGPRGRWRRAADAFVHTAAFVDFIDHDVAGAELPMYQRIEVIASPRIGDSRAVARAISRFHDISVVTTVASLRVVDEAASTDTAKADTAKGDTPVDTAHGRSGGLTFAAGDTLDHFHDWRSEIGSATVRAHMSDFDDLLRSSTMSAGDSTSANAGETWWTVAHLDVPSVRRVSEVAHFDRVEGLYTGMGAAVSTGGTDFTNTMLRVMGGYAWAEHVVRGSAELTAQRAPWTYALHTGRVLDNTNDFRSRFDYGTAIGALLRGRDDYDYVDRVDITASVARTAGRAHPVFFRIDASAASDRAVSAHVTYGLIHLRGDSALLPNRGIVPGRYIRAGATIDYQADINEESVHPGLGALLRYEVAAGDLHWQRIEARVVARHSWGALSVAGRADAGMLVSSAPPPQQLFELGRTEGLTGYGYKQFAGDRAGLTRGSVWYELPVLIAPRRIWKWSIPGPAPAPYAEVESGWAAADDPATLHAIALLGSYTDANTGRTITDPTTGAPVPLSEPTHGLRTTMDIGMRLFGGGLRVGIGRPVDQTGRWSFVIGSGRPF